MRYILEKYNGLKSRFDCPQCNGKKTFTKYIDTETKEYLSDHVGRCNKIDKCEYHFKPKQFFADNKEYTQIYKPQQKKIAPPPKPMFTIPIEQLDATLTHYESNNFALILLKLFGEHETVKLLDLYKIGTSKKWNGANIFWQKDANGIVRTGKIMLYNIETNKRVKQPYEHISWVHKDILKDGHELRQCFFGEHLINQFKTKTIAIVESEKSAIICTYFLPEYVWLSAGNINGLSIEKFKVLSGRKVVLFPDLGKANDIWQQKANEFKHIAEVSISDYLQRIATKEQRANALDLADYLIETIIKNVGHVDNVA
ncbi:MAG: DUF6371 domain-containing protein [Bacteroidota bacterium]